MTLRNMANLSPLPCPATRAHLRREHVAWLNPKGSVGRVWIGRKVIEGDRETFEGDTVDPADAPSSPHFETAQLVSANRFWGRRRSSETLKSWGSIPLDFDYNQRGLPYDGWEPEDVMALLVDGFEAAGLPQPSAWIFSGRNIQGTFAFDGAKAAAWPRVRATIAALHGPVLASNGMPLRRRRRDDAELDAHEARMLPLWRLFRDCGLDRVCTDAARVVRLVGSVNPKSGRMARLLAPAVFADATRYTFHALADAILPVARHVLTERRRERTEAVGANDNAAPKAVRRVPSGYWPTVLSDLLALREHRGGIRKGGRETWLFLTANATAQMKGGSREDWVAELAPLAGLSEREAFAALGSLDRRQRRHDAGETDTWEGTERSPLYGYSAARMVDLLDIQVDEADAAGLRALVPGGAVAMTPAERQTARRRRLNASARTDTVEDRIVDGLFGLGMRSEGWTIAEVCYTTGRGRTSQLRAMAEAAEDLRVNGPTKLTIPSEPTSTVEVSEAQPVVHSSSRYIVGSASRGSRPASKPSAPAPGEVRIVQHTVHHAEVETATARWTWITTKLPVFGWNEVWEIQGASGASVDPADVALAEDARQALSDRLMASQSRPRRAASHRPSSARVPAARTVPTVAYDLKREAELYRIASGR
ncbi:hypothetical protein ASF22_22690 [Methylobacterium sp. Leaf87]|uniref:hypothetical protein n=1 Tax=Methylobacterium sp. Leaf87 TaxID=1736243 RepID=UPI0006FE32E7|nr:hypothetical protein [Methylobacterium sp. Leaf87]KQO57229.1 hypothetical protein ASF22_22690 [Methylobacterium sp. Leaf87]